MHMVLDTRNPGGVTTPKIYIQAHSSSDHFATQVCDEDRHSGMHDDRRRGDIICWVASYWMFSLRYISWCDWLVFFMQVRLLRSMLEWEAEMLWEEDDEASQPPELPPTLRTPRRHAKKHRLNNEVAGPSPASVSVAVSNGLKPTTNLHLSRLKMMDTIAEAPDHSNNSQSDVMVREQCPRSSESWAGCHFSHRCVSNPLVFHERFISYGIPMQAISLQMRTRLSLICQCPGVYPYAYDRKTHASTSSLSRWIVNSVLN